MILLLVRLSDQHQHDRNPEHFLAIVNCYFVADANMTATHPHHARQTHSSNSINHYEAGI